MNYKKGKQMSESVIFNKSPQEKGNYKVEEQMPYIEENGANTLM